MLLNKTNFLSKINKQVKISGINYGGFLFTVLELINKWKNNIVIVENEELLDKVYNFLKKFNDNVYILNEKKIVFFDSYSYSKDIEKNRLEVIYHMLEDKDINIITTPNALFSYINNIEKYRKNKFIIEKNSQINLEYLEEKLVYLGYTKTSKVESFANFTVKGNIVDIFSPMYKNPVRIEFFSDFVYDIRFFYADNQKKINNIEKVIIYPAKEGLIFDEKEKVLNNLYKLKDSEIKNFGYNNDRIKKITYKYDFLIEKIENNLQIVDFYRYNNIFFNDNYKFFDFAKENNYHFYIWNYKNLIEKIDDNFKLFKLKFDEHFLNDEVFCNQIDLHVSKKVFMDSIFNSNSIFFDFIRNDDLKCESIETKFKDIIFYNKQIKLLANDLVEFIKNEYIILIALKSKEKINSIKLFFEDFNINLNKIFEIDNFDNLKKGINLIILDINNGFINEDEKIVVFTEREIYGNIKEKIDYKKEKHKYIKSFNDIQLGDYVVHNSYGIGKYMGICQLDVDSEKKDYIKINYKNDDILYLEVEKLENLQKYISDDSKTVKLNKLGSNDWKNTKKKVRAAIEEIQDDLILLYAKRTKKKGFAFSEDTIWQKDFEDAFKYTETFDQLRAIEEIKEDMQKPFPMDRLLLGDVGYGKTEVAFRACFKAVMDKKQVAMLVPTTILAQQHYNTAVNRFSDFGVIVECLSRFKTKKEQNIILEKLQKGFIDILIGTHRILSDDVKFKDLGFLVIDEEQRFGVNHKEKIKILKENIDVLTLSATPIPRTLNMSLMGIRDMSVIENPPENRFPVQTYVSEFKENLIRDAILQEIDRNGQVYFFHNKVIDIEEFTNYIKNIVPKARIEYAHGQLSEKKLEKIMLRFLEHNFDVLVCTSIIETGLDIKNVNTIIIDEADKLGLSQLYQLKGRVGRSNRVGYAYLCYNGNNQITEVSQKRLKAMKDFSELGLGFKVAMRDLEIRGAGNILGAKQSGHLSSVGYEMYVKMIEDVINKNSIENDEDVMINIKISAFIPETYLNDYSQKMEIYKKISVIKSEEDKKILENELLDRFGQIPYELENLILLGYLRYLANKLKIIDIRERDNEYFITFSKISDDIINKKGFTKLLEDYDINELELLISKKKQLKWINYRKGIKKQEIMYEIINILKYLIIK